MKKVRFIGDIPHASEPSISLKIKKFTVSI